MIPVSEAHKRAQLIISVCVVTLVCEEVVGQRGEQCVELLIADLYKSPVEHVDASC